MKKIVYLIVLALILGLVLTGCSLLSNISQVPTTDQSGITYLTKNGSDPVLVARWKFDEGSGSNAHDSSDNENDGAINGAIYILNTMSGFGTALSFNGSSDWVDIPDLSITGDFSIEFWVNLDPGISNPDAVVGQEGGGQDINFYLGKCRWYTAGEDGFPHDAIIATTSAVASTWEYYAITRSGDTLTLYRNGVVDATIVISDINTLPFHPKAIGRGNAGFFDGLIDEVRIWDGALTADQLGDMTPPIITMLGISPDTAEAGFPYTDAGATALDNVDGDITGFIVTVNPVNTAVLGTYTVTYDVSDAAANSAIQVTRTVNVVDTTPPVITLSGDTPVNVVVGSTYTDAGATAEDNYDGDITGSIVTVNPVNTAVLGTYIVTYNVADSSGNAATQVTRTVNVVFGFKGLLAPYAAPPRAFKVGSSIPLKWHYTNSVGDVVESLAAEPRVRILLNSTDIPLVTVDPIVVEDSGKSGLRYDSDTDMWIFNWQTKEGFESGLYWIWITSAQTGQANGPFQIQLR